VIASWLWWLVCRAFGVPAIDPVVVDAVLASVREDAGLYGL
jgi:hypothetical protein